MAKWTIELKIDCGDDEETESIVDDMVYEGLRTIQSALDACNIERNEYTLNMSDAHGNRTVAGG